MVGPDPSTLSPVREIMGVEIVLCARYNVGTTTILTLKMGKLRQSMFYRQNCPLDQILAMLFGVLFSTRHNLSF